MKKIIILIIPFFVINLYAQESFTTKNKKAIKFYLEARDYYDIRDYENAETMFMSAIDKDKDFAEAYVMLGILYTETSQYEKAIDSYKKSIKSKADLFPNIYFSVAELEMSLGKYQDALNHFAELKKYKINKKLIDATKRLEKNAKFGIKAMANPVPFNPINMGGSINTNNPEYFPCITADDNLFLFTRLIKDEKAPSNYGVQEDFYVSMKDKNGNWLPAKNIGMPINSHFNEGAPTLSPDGLTLIFTACEVFGSYGKERKGAGSCDLFFTSRIGNNWAYPVNMGVPISSPNWESQPSYSSDGKTLYFISNRDGGLGSQDIWVTELNDDGYWQEPKNLGPIINTPYREESVFIHPDNQTLYFSSAGHVGMGGTDIFVSRKDKNGNWSKPVNLGYPINTWKDENSILVNAYGNVAFMASNRDGGFGSLDIYNFDLYSNVQPNRVVYLKGKVYDKETKQSVYAKFELIDLKTGKQVLQSYSNKENGHFLVCLPVNREYALNVSKSGYLFYSENYSLITDKNNDIEPFFMNVPLVPINSKDSTPVQLKNIFFETDSYVLKPESKVELNKLVDFLQKNPTISIMIMGHTDDVGDDAYNLTLSNNRAKSVVEYLISNNIQQNRLQYKGYGETKPLVPNDSDKNRSINRRTEFMILGNK